MHLYTTYHRLAIALITAILLSLGMTERHIAGSELRAKPIN